jgi:peptide/nickel transport system permease protein
MFAIALLAPIIAGSKPLLWFDSNGVSAPFLKDFFSPSEGSEQLLNICYNYILLLVIFGLFIKTVCSKYFRIIFPILALLLIIPFVLSTSQKDPTKYKQLQVIGKGKGIFPLISHSPYEVNQKLKQPPSWPEHPCGTDSSGRDVLSRIIHGSRVSLTVGIVSIVISSLIGIAIGGITGYFGGILDICISRIIEVIMCFPIIFLILMIIAVLDQRSIFNIIAVIGLTSWTGLSRLVRGEVLKQRQQDYVTAAQALGASHLRIIFRHIMPNCLAPIFITMTFGVAGAILMESSLSFLGFGVDIPTPSWGELLNQALEAPHIYWWLTLFPGLPIFFTVTIYNLVGEGLRDALDPRLKQGE